MRKSVAEKGGRSGATGLQLPLCSVKVPTLTAAVAVTLPLALSVSAPFERLIAWSIVKFAAVALIVRFGRLLINPCTAVLLPTTIESPEETADKLPAPLVSLR